MARLTSDEEIYDSGQLVEYVSSGVIGLALLVKGNCVTDQPCSLSETWASMAKHVDLGKYTWDYYSLRDVYLPNEQWKKRNPIMANFPAMNCSFMDFFS